jgi:putative nucleotidyltransferase with HDIG domain
LGHAFELVGIVLVAVPVALDLRRSHQSRPLIGDLRGAELVAAEETFLGSQVRALMQRLAEKDTYTEEHTRRVALRAVQVGETLGFPPTRLRELAIGGLLHDIGKLSVPDTILRKPGSLDETELAVIRKHPTSGVRLLAELGGFSESVRRLVRDHHERLDGSGYPAGLQGTEVELDARILAVCDVYDALISPRVYRDCGARQAMMTRGGMPVRPRPPVGLRRSTACWRARRGRSLRRWTCAGRTAHPGQSGAMRRDRCRAEFPPPTSSKRRSASPGVS